MQNPSHRRGFSVNVFLPSGEPDGLKVVEKSNWTGRGLVIPRAIFAESLGRAELDRTGVYLLVGPSESSSLPALYVGEGDPVKPRLDQHAKQKDFWTHAVVFTSKDSNLNKAHVQRLEARLVDLAGRAKRCILQNGNCPAAPSLSESEEAFAEGFLDDVLLCLPILGYSLFEDSAAAAASAGPAGSITLHLKAKGVAAAGVDTPAGFVVHKGSRAVGDDKITPSMLEYVPHVKDRRDDLIRQGVLAKDGDAYVFTQDYVFGSPSTAASVVMGRNANGRVDWKTADGKSLKDLQDAAAGGMST
jgi:hypothetical protein